MLELLDAVLRHRPGGGRDHQRQDDDDRRVAHREEEADADRATAAQQHQPGGVVDRCDVVGVEGVPHAQDVGEGASAGERPGGGRAVAVVEEECPAEDVQHHYRGEDP